MSRSGWFLLLCIAAGLAIRLDFLQATGFVIDSDEAIVGLMAKHALERGTMPVFYYGQHYMGSFEPLAVAAAFALFGVSETVLKLVPLFFSLLLVPLMYELAREIAGRRAAAVAALLTALPPSPLVVWSAMARGGFIELVVIGAYALLVAVRWLKDDREDPARLALLGVVLGFGWWVNNQILYFIIPAAFVLAAKPAASRVRAVAARGALTGLAFLAGGLPFWLYNLLAGFPSFGLFRRASIADAIEHLEGAFTVSLPMLLGAKRFWSTADILPGLSLTAGLLYGLIFAAFVAFRIRQIGALVLVRLDRAQPIEIALVFLAASFGIFSVSSFGYLFTAPRYLLPAYVGIVLLTSYVVGRLMRSAPAGGAALTALVLALNLGSSYFGGRAVPGQPFVFEGERASRSHAELRRWLAEREITMLRTNYWIGYRLAFETRERVRFAVFQEPRQVRIPEYERGLSRAERETLPLLLVPTQAAIVRPALDALGFSYREARVSGYVVLYDLAPLYPDLRPIDRAIVAAAATHRAEAAAQAVDGDLSTRWGSAAPQRPGMEYELRLSEPALIRGIRYHFGEWGHDEPRGLSIELVGTDGSREQVLNEERYWAVRYLQGARDGFTLAFEPRETRGVVLRQTGEHELFDWSIAEIELLR